MDNSVQSLARYRLSKSESDLNAAKILFENNLYAQSINRSYYSIFHSVRSLLSFDKFDSKKHSGIISYFNEHYIKTGLIEKNFSVIVMSAERIRTESATMIYSLLLKNKLKNFWLSVTKGRGD